MPDYSWLPPQQKQSRFGRLCRTHCEDSIVAVGILIFTSAIVYTIRGRHLIPSIVTGVAVAIFFFFFYTCRFLLRSPRTIVLSDVGLTLQLRNGKSTEIRWEHVQRAIYSFRWGARWRFWVGQTVIQVWEDGINAEQSNQMQQRITDGLTARQIPLELWDVTNKKVSALQ